MSRKRGARQSSGKRPEVSRTLRWVIGAVVAVSVLTASFLVWLRRSEPIASAQPDVILVTIDTLRADALGFAGNRKVQTPFLDALARESTVFTNAHAHNVVTFPSHVNILTGLYPYQHGCRDNSGYTVDPKFKTVAALLREQGYATGAFVGAFPLDARYGLGRGFDVYDDRYPEGKGKLAFRIAERRAEEVLAPAMAWWNQLAGKRFMWVHLYDPHAPYLPPPEFAARYPSELYLGEVAYVDSVLQRFLAPLLKTERPPLLIITADHGEALGDHGELTHGLFAYESTLKVPLLVRNPDSLIARTHSHSVRHIDIAPTILARAGAAIPAELPGKSLLVTDETPRPSYFEALSASLNRGWAPLVGLVDQDHKYIDLPVPELYNLETDPAESRNLFSESRRVLAQLRKILVANSPAQSPTERVISAEQSAQLLSLGYISGSAAKKSYTVADDPKNLVDIDNMLHHMVELYQLGQLDRAVEVATQVIERQPDMPVGQEMLAFLLQQAERTEAGIATLREAIARGTATEAMKMRLGLMLSEIGRAREAVEVLEPFASKNDVDLLNAYGIALADVGRPTEAVRQFDRVLKIDPTNATAYQNLGIVALRSRQPDLAQQYLSKALELDPQLPLALNTLGVLYAQSGRKAEAVELWTKAVAIEPTLYDALFNLAVVAGQIQRWQIAESALSRFIETAPPKRYSRDLAAARAMLREIERRKG